MQITINENSYEIPDDSTEMLLWVLRDQLGLIGTKYGCGMGICGACMVLVEGVATRSCITPAVAIAGRKIETIEGIAHSKTDLHPVQQAFIEHQVPQCGWCMSGQVMTAVALLDANPQPTEDEIIEGMGNNYCRCGCYVRIQRAVASAAETMQASSTEITTDQGVRA